MSESLFLYFGDDLFSKLLELSLNHDSNRQSNYKIFNSLNVSSRIHSIENVFLGWSYLLLKAGDKIYRTGICNSESKVLEICATLDKKICSVSCGLNNGLFVTEDGHCYFYSNRDFDQKLLSCEEQKVKIKDIVTDDLYSLAVSEDEKVFLINFEEKSLSHLPFSMAIIEVACGKEHVLLLASSGQIFTFGCGSKGQLGHGTIENQDKPLIIDALDGVEMKSIAAGGWHSAAISYAGDLYMWGWNESGQVGLPCSELHSKTLPLTEIETVCCLPRIVEIKDDIKVLSVSCGSRHTAVLTEYNKVWTWGWNGYGQLGHRKCLLSDKPQEVTLPNGFVPQQVKCAFWSTLIKGYMTTKCI